jgi:hypothetical protein
MEIPRQKKTVRVAVTRPSVKKGAIVTVLKTAANQRGSTTNYNMSSLLKFGASWWPGSEIKPSLPPRFCVAILVEGACSVLSFQFLAPERNCVLVSAQVPVNPCK